MANVLLGATGSVAAVRVPALYDALTGAGHAVKIVATSAATYFFDPAPFRAAGVLSLDEDEWPGRDEGRLYQRGDAVQHIELRKWADVFALAPLDANTLAKLAVGLCDNCLTCVWRAWDLARPVVMAPAMNTLMWQHPFTRRHLRAIAADAGAGHIPAHLADDALIQQINDRSPTLRVVAPVTKQLACGDTGPGALAEVADIAHAVQFMLGRARAA
ncbi:flavoprotein [Gemmata sp. JC717]|uniref:flavoprotein n=1 Tax=Gemmata algarum TaxID=2975278 RepID=UPI0021BAAF54|nr:flavoprotein [Gemmata algarum]MDY3552184.1 flavoprotein [Gemmata algarum]